MDIAIDPQEMSRALGVPLFQPSFFLPRYPDGEWGKWRIRHMGLGFDHGYYTRRWLVYDTPVLMRRNPEDAQLWETWMSLTPHELESQEPGCMFGRGHTVIMGLGMGWIALNVALNPAVRRVTVIELDPEVIDLFNAANVVNQVPADIREKINILRADALEWQPREPVDFLFADIWRTLGESETLEHVRRMQQNVQAESIYYWGQELTLYASFQHLYGPQTPLTFEGLNKCLAEEIRLPLILPWGEEYAARIEAAIQNRRARDLPVRSLWK